ncbi:DUF294 nucleotidyltransferase-like domain-containing protein [Bacillus sp. FSL K6-3431]|uniref:DUF294 nucleotidyltransferase-like domain-containing protein n=1 Tax=Bacillus sp. FSL K6-3431 TaxID=2921500 RepID=UPI0030FBB770
MLGLHASYQSLKIWHNHIISLQSNSDELQLFHEYVMKKVYEIALEEMTRDYGAPPCKYSWFVTGSAGRCEQARLSDQDHGIIYDEINGGTDSYFLTFGEKISSGLYYMGYPLCQGNVMSSNRLWCRSITEWEIQIEKWIKEDKWESLRYLLIFFDARVIVGNEKTVLYLKKLIYQAIQEQSTILGRLLENTKYTVKAIGLFNQFLTIASGPYTGFINLKLTAIIPYVNAVRLLAIHEKIEKTSTLGRIEALSNYPTYKRILGPHYRNFKKLLQQRLKHDNGTNYEDAHYINVKSLNKKEKLEIKQILKEVRRLQKFTEMIIQRAI